MPGIEVDDTGERPKVSVICGVRNEYPCVMWTMLSFVEDLEYFGYDYEVIIVDNMSTDNTADIMLDKFRRWVREKKLKVIRYNDKPANVTVRNIGVQAADGDVVFLADGHLSIATGTCHGMIQTWIRKGKTGAVHPSIHIVGDTRNIRCYGYRLKLEQKFWGDLSRDIPDIVRIDGGKYKTYRVPIASHCCLLTGREQYLDFGGYNENFRCYSGGEPYFSLKWWLLGSEVWMYPEGLVRHGFGVNARWVKVTNDKEELQRLGNNGRRPGRMRNRVQTRDGRQVHDLIEGDEYLSYSRGYAWNNEQFQHNFMLAAYTIGGYKWLQQRYQAYFDQRKGNERYIADIKRLRQEVLQEGAADRKFIASRQVMTLDELLEKKPWDRWDDL